MSIARAPGIYDPRLKALAKYSNNPFIALFGDHNGKPFVSYQGDIASPQGGLIIGKDGLDTLDGVDDHLLIPSNLGIGTSNNWSIIVGVTVPDTARKGAFVQIGDNNNGFGLGIGGTTCDDTGNDLIALKEAVAWGDSNYAIGTGFHTVAIFHRQEAGPVDNIYFYIDGVNGGPAFSGNPIAPGQATRIGGYVASGGENRHSNCKIHFVLIGESLQQGSGFNDNDIIAESARLFPAGVWEQRVLEKPRDSWFNAGGAAAELAGAATASATSTGALTTQIPIIGAAATVATASGALSTSIPLLGAAVVTVTAFGDLSAQIRLDGAAIAQALAAGGITTGIPLAGAATGTASASGSLDASAALAAAAQAIATAVGSLTTQITLSGAAISQAIASGDLTAPGSGLSGAASGQVSAAGSLTTGIPLVGAAQAYATGVGGLTTIIPLAGASASVSAATGNLTVQTTLTGAAIAQALAGGVLTTQVVLSGAAVSLASAAGVLTGGTAIVDTTWLVRPKVRRYSVKPDQRIYKGSR